MNEGRTWSSFGDQRRLRHPAGAGDDLAFERVEPARRRLRESRMHPHETVDRRAERRLASVHQPLAGRQRGKVRAPHRVDEARLVRDRHAARGGAEDQREPPARIAGFSVRARAQRAECARMRVDEPRPDRRSRDEPHRGGFLGREPSRERRSRRDDLRAETGEAVGAQDAKPDAVEEFARPAPLVREIAELAGDRAERAGERARRAKGEVIGEAEEMRGPGEGPGLPAREPDELRRLHLGRQRAPEIPQDLMPAGVDPLGVVGRAVIHPHDHVALGRVGRTDRQRPQVLVERDQRTGRGEAEARDRLAWQARGLDRLAHGLARRAPDVGGRLLDDVAGLAPDRDRPPGAGDELPGPVENPGAGAARADVHPDISLAHGAWRFSARAPRFGLSLRPGKESSPPPMGDRRQAH